MKLSVGTSGYSYKEWKGPFYPEKLPAKEMLGFYAERLPAVEINNTFYRMPKESVLQDWAAKVPESFRFVLKASRRITHFKRLKGAEDETGYLWRTAGVLGERLGAVLFQLPPNLPADLSRLQTFLETLPEDGRAAFEFRHPSWQDDEVLEALRGRGCAWVAVDDGESEPEAPRSTADWGYLRLRAPAYTGAELSAWAQRVRAQDWEQAFVFFKHEDAGAGPALAAEFLDVAEKLDERRRVVPAAGPARRRETG